MAKVEIALEFRNTAIKWREEASFISLHKWEIERKTIATQAAGSQIRLWSHQLYFIEQVEYQPNPLGNI